MRLGLLIWFGFVSASSYGQLKLLDFIGKYQGQDAYGREMVVEVIPGMKHQPDLELYLVWSPKNGISYYEWIDFKAVNHRTHVFHPNGRGTTFLVDYSASAPTSVTSFWYRERAKLFRNLAMEKTYQFEKNEDGKMMLRTYQSEHKFFGWKKKNG